MNRETEGKTLFYISIYNQLKADIISGIYGIREHMDADEPWMLLDFGTNGEMVLWTGEEYFATAAAADRHLRAGIFPAAVPVFRGQSAAL